MLHCVYSSLIYNTQELERTQMSSNRGMDTESVVHLHNLHYSVIKKKDFKKSIGKWMELETIILSVVTQLLKNTHGMQSLIIGYYPQKALNTQETINRP